MTYNYNGVDSKPLTPNPLRFGRRLNINYFNENSTLVEMNRLVEMNDFTELWTKKLWTKETLDCYMSNIVILKVKIISKETQFVWVT